MTDSECSKMELNFTCLPGAVESILTSFPRLCVRIRGFRLLTVINIFQLSFSYEIFNSPVALNCILAGEYDVACTVTLLRGRYNILVDTGSAWEAELIKEGK